MGWTFSHKEPGVKAVEFIKNEMGQKWWDEHAFAATATRNAVFVLVKGQNPESQVYVPEADGTTRELLVFAIQNARDYYNFGYKDMSETMGPNGWEAPLSILAQASPLKPVTENEPSMLKWAREYRERCFAKAKANAAKRALKAGQTVTLPEALSFGGVKHQTFTVTLARHRRGQRTPSAVFRASDGMLCRLTAEQLVGATIV